VQITWTPDPIRVGQPARLRIILTEGDPAGAYKFSFEDENPFSESSPLTHRMRQGLDFEPDVVFGSSGTRTLTVQLPPPRGSDTRTRHSEEFAIPVLDPVLPQVPQATVALVAADPPASDDEILWTFIKDITNRMRFDEFHEFVRPRMTGANGPEWYGTDAFRRLRRLSEEFVETAADPIGAVTANPPKPTVAGELSKSEVVAGIARSYVSSERGDLSRPFLGFDVPDRPGGSGQGPGQRSERARPGVPGDRPTSPAALGQFPLPNVPFVELIHTLWLEEGMLFQTMNHILARFQNRRPGRGYDALARFDLNPLLPLRNLFWGLAETQYDQLTVRRRDAEYRYQYGLELKGKAIPPSALIVETRSQFLEGFHALLNASLAFYKERDDKTVDADAFPLLSSLREVHLVLARGAHNQFADLPVKARAETLTLQWILAQPETGLFLGGPTMVPFEEGWMGPVDTMKTLQHWHEGSITHFFELATHGEQLLLSIRHGRWNESSRTREDAANWALTWRNEVQRYIHAYRAVTGVDLSTGIDATMPSQLLARRVHQQARRA
jgi:hypothetical protein